MVRPSTKNQQRIRTRKIFFPFVILVMLCGQSLHGQTLPTKANHKLDSISRRATDVLDSLDSIGRRGLRLASKADSVNHLLQLPVEKLNKALATALEKINTPLDSVSRGVNSRVDKAKKRLLQPVDSLERVLNGSLGNASTKLNNYGSQLGISAKSSPNRNVKLLAGNEHLPNLQIPTANLSAPGLTQPFGDTQVPNVNPQLPDLKSLTQERLQDLPGFTEIKEAKTGFNKVTSKIDQASQVASDIEKIAEGKIKDAKTLPTLVEKELIQRSGLEGNLTQVQALTAQQEQYKALIDKYKDKKRMQEEMKSKALSVANEYLTSKAPIITQSQSKLTKAKKLYGSFQSIKTIAKRGPNDMKQRTFIERLVPGVNLQIYRNDHVVVDVAPVLGYRLSNRWTVGLSGMYRVGADKQFNHFLQKEGVYGMRTYGQFTVKDGFFLHGELEALRLDSALTKSINDERSSRLFGAYVGIGKSYAIGRRLRGNAVAMYRIDFNGGIPQQSKFGVRIGFQLETKKQRNLAREIRKGRTKLTQAPSLY